LNELLLEYFTARSSDPEGAEDVPPPATLVEERNNWYHAHPEDAPAGWVLSDVATGDENKGKSVKKSKKSV